MTIEKTYCEYVTKKFFQKFENADKIGEKILGTMGVWHVEFQIKNYRIYISSDRGFLEFHVFSKDGTNLGLMTKNQKVFDDFFRLSNKNIDTIIDFLYEKRDELFIDE